MAVRMLSIFALLILCACKPVSETDISGTYMQDKFVEMQGTKTPAVDMLTLNDDHSFVLVSKAVHGTLITGEWEILNSRYAKSSSGQKEARATIGFSYDEKTTMGELKGNIIYFSAPEGFHPQVFKHVTYVKRQP